jgi:DNA-binding HxlR family transcriptional regulator
VLRAHAQGPQRCRDLQEAARSFAEATIRDAVRNLCRLGALERHGVSGARNAVVTSLTPTGEEMLAVADALDTWLGRCPMGPIKLVDGSAKTAVKALAEGWSSNLMRELAVAPRTLTELSSLVSEISYPAMERRITWMRKAGQVSPLPEDARGTRYVPDDWLRLGIAPLAVASRCEQRDMEDATAIGNREIEALLLLGLPLVSLRSRASGSCLLTSIEGTVTAEEGAGVAGVEVAVAGGEIVLCIPTALEAEPDTWAIGTPDAWLEVLIEGRIGRLRIGGANSRIARALTRDMHRRLFVES